MAEWRTERRVHDAGWWLLSGTNTLGVIHGERTAKSIVRDHNDMETAAKQLAAERLSAASPQPTCEHGETEAHPSGDNPSTDWCLGPDLPYAASPEGSTG